MSFNYFAHNKHTSNLGIDTKCEYRSMEGFRCQKEADYGLWFHMDAKETIMEIREFCSDHIDEVKGKYPGSKSYSLYHEDNIYTEDDDSEEV